MTKVKYTLKDYFYALDLWDVDNIKEGLKKLYKENKGDLSNISEIYDGKESYVIEDMTISEIEKIIED